MLSSIRSDWAWCVSAASYDEACAEEADAPTDAAAALLTTKTVKLWMLESATPNTGNLAAGLGRVVMQNRRETALRRDVA